MTISLSNPVARHLVLHLQGLSHPPHLKQSPQQLLTLICQLGFVQVDSIQWVERAQHMTLFARNQTYRPDNLKKLIEKDQLLFEGWTHDAAIIPCEYFPHWQRHFKRQEEILRKKFVNWQGDGFIGRCDTLLKRIENDGALRSRDLEKPKRQGPQKMWQWHDGKVTLEYLWRTGKLAISGRDGFQKIYDLTHRAIPQALQSAPSDHKTFIDWACRSALERLGFGTPVDIARYFDLVSIQEVKDWLDSDFDQKAVNITVETRDGTKPREVVARKDIEQLVEQLPQMPKRLRVLSPFDPVIRNRNRLTWLFNFDYRIEIYVPEEKRKYGYYVFPLLENDRLIGRIDMRANRHQNCLQIKKLWLEKGIKLSSARKGRLDAELVRQARLAGVSDIEWHDGAL